MTDLSLSPQQIQVLTHYDNGEFKHLAESGSQAEFDQALADCGDGLLRFLLVELAPAEDCNTEEEAARRINTAIRQLKHLLDQMSSTSRPKDVVKVAHWYASDSHNPDKADYRLTHEMALADLRQSDGFLVCDVATLADADAPSLSVCIQIDSPPQGTECAPSVRIALDHDEPMIVMHQCGRELVLELGDFIKLEADPHAKGTGPHENPRFWIKET